MIIEIKKITEAVQIVSDLTAEEKNVPGVLLRCSQNSIGVGYYDSHNACMIKVPVVHEEGDFEGDVVVEYSSLVRAIGNCQPSGNIVVRSIKFEFGSGIIKVTADQELKVSGTDENDTVYRKMATKTMDVAFNVVAGTTNKKVELLARIDYNTMFNNEDYDTWNRKELVKAITAVSTEKARAIYISSKLQKLYVNNTAYTCSVNAEDEFEATPEMIAEARGVDYDAKTPEEKVVIDKAVALIGKKIKYGSCVLSSNVMKMAGNIVNRLSDASTDIYLCVKDAHLVMFNSDETVGIYLETTKASRQHTEAFSKYLNIFSYDRFQLTFVREFLADSIKSAVNSSGSVNTVLSFRKSELDSSKIDLIINSVNSGASVSDEYKVQIDDAIDTDGSLLSTNITISLKTFAEMLNQLHSNLVALDISKTVNEQTCLRLAEVDTDKVIKEWTAARTKLGLNTLTEDGKTSDGQALAPTPVEAKTGYRTNTLQTCEYTVVSMKA